MKKSIAIERVAKLENRTNLENSDPILLLTSVYSARFPLQGGGYKGRAGFWEEYWDD